MSNNEDDQHGKNNQKPSDQTDGSHDDWSAFDHLLSHDEDDAFHPSLLQHQFFPNESLDQNNYHEGGGFALSSPVNTILAGSSVRPDHAHPFSTQVANPLGDQPLVNGPHVPDNLKAVPPSVSPARAVSTGPSRTAEAEAPASAAVAASSPSPAPASEVCSINGSEGEEEKVKGRAEACERKRNREKQRRNDVNQQFTDLSSLLKSIEEAENENTESSGNSFGNHAGEENDKKQRLGRGFYGRTGPTNRIDLIARAIEVLKHLWKESKESGAKIDSLKEQLKQAKADAARAKSDAATASAQVKPDVKEQPMMMMIPMMMPTGTSCGGGSQGAMSFVNPMPGITGQSTQQNFLPFPFMPTNAGGFMQMPNPMMSTFAAAQMMQAQQQKQQAISPPQMHQQQSQTSNSMQHQQQQNQPPNSIQQLHQQPTHSSQAQRGQGQQQSVDTQHQPAQDTQQQQGVQAQGTQQQPSSIIHEQIQPSQSVSPHITQQISVQSIQPQHDQPPPQTNEQQQRQANSAVQQHQQGNYGHIQLQQPSNGAGTLHSAVTSHGAQQQPPQGTQIQSQSQPEQSTPGLQQQHHHAAQQQLPPAVHLTQPLTHALQPQVPQQVMTQGIQQYTIPNLQQQQHQLVAHSIQQQQTITQPFPPQQQQNPYMHSMWHLPGGSFVPAAGNMSSHLMSNPTAWNPTTQDARQQNLTSSGGPQQQSPTMHSSSSEEAKQAGEEKQGSGGGSNNNLAHCA